MRADAAGNEFVFQHLSGMRRGTEKRLGSRDWHKEVSFNDTGLIGYRLLLDTMKSAPQDHEASNENRADRKLYPRDRKLEGPAVLPGRDRGRRAWLGRSLCDRRQGDGDRRMRPRDGATCDRPAGVQHPPYRADHVRGFCDPPRLD